MTVIANAAAITEIIISFQSKPKMAPDCVSGWTGVAEGDTDVVGVNSVVETVGETVGAGVLVAA